MKEYPQGCHPNSLRALDENRYKGQYTKGQSEEASQKSAILRKILKEAVQYGMVTESDEEWDALIETVWKGIKTAAMNGDLHALKIICNALK